MPRSESSALPLSEILGKRGIDLRKAAKLCDVSVRLMDILASGGVTLPSLAKQVGHGLGLTREQVRPLGQALDGDAFLRRTGVRPLEIDCDPMWWKSYRLYKRERRKPVPRPYMDEVRLMRHLIRLDKDLSAIKTVTGGRTPGAINRRNPEERKAVIRAVEALLGLPEGELETERRQESWEILFLMDYDAIRRIMAAQGLSIGAIARKLVVREWSVSRIIEQAREGEAVEVETARRLAGALGVEPGEIGRKIIQRHHDRTDRVDERL